LEKQKVFFGDFSAFGILKFHCQKNLLGFTSFKDLVKFCIKLSGLFNSIFQVFPNRNFRISHQKNLFFINLQQLTNYLKNLVINQTNSFKFWKNTKVSRFHLKMEFPSKPYTAKKLVKDTTIIAMRGLGYMLSLFFLSLLAMLTYSFVHDICGFYSSVRHNNVLSTVKTAFLQI